MRKTLLAALAAVSVLSPVTLAGRTAAMTIPALTIPVPPSAIATEAAGGMVRYAAIVCGSGGCATVQTKAHQRRNFHPLGSHS